MNEPCPQPMCPGKLTLQASFRKHLKVCPACGYSVRVDIITLETGTKH